MYSELVAETQGIASYQETDNPKRVIKRSNGKKPNVSSVILAGIYMAVAASLVVALSIICTGYRNGSFSTVILVVMLSTVTAVNGSRAVEKESFVSVCEGRVYGRAMKNSYGFRLGAFKWFNVGFDMITCVEKRKSLFSNIRIKCGADTYDCMVNEPDEIIGLIKEKVNHLQV